MTTSKIFCNETYLVAKLLKDNVNICCKSNSGLPIGHHNDARVVPDRCDPSTLLQLCGKKRSNEQNRAGGDASWST